MRTIALNVNLDGAVSPDNVFIGHEGEHNVASLDISLVPNLVSSISFFKLALGDYLSEELYPKNDKITYSLPQSVMFAPVLLIQLEGYKENGTGELELVFKSDIVTGEIKPSIAAFHEIPKEMEAGLDGAVSELSYYVEKSNELADCIATTLTELDSQAVSHKETMSALLEASREILHETKETLSNKADIKSSLAGYGIKDAYTKSEIDLKLLEKTNANSVYTRSEINNALSSGMCQDYKRASNDMFEEYFYNDDLTLRTTHYLYIEYPSVMRANAKYKLRLNKYFDFTEIRNFCVCIGDIHHPVIENIPLTFDIENYAFTESAEFTLPDTVGDSDKMFFRFDCVGNAPNRPAPYTLFALRLLPCYNKEQVDGLLESKADSSDVPTKVSELENDSGYLVADDIKVKADSSDVPTKVSELENDIGYLVADDIKGKADKNKILDYITYQIVDGSVTITDCDTSISGTHIIPEIIEGYPVTVIGNDAFFKCSGLVSITIPNTVIDIGDRAFSGCTTLESLVIPDGITIIKSNSIPCKCLKKLYLPDSILTIEYGIFPETEEPYSIDVYYNGTREQWRNVQITGFANEGYDSYVTLHYKYGDVPTPVVNTDAVNKEYVDSLKAKKVLIQNGATIALADNTTYYAQGDISTLTVFYPEGNFISSLEFTLASEGDITITLPESKYIGGAPAFAEGETWELNIKNGVVVGGLIE